MKEPRAAPAGRAVMGGMSAGQGPGRKPGLGAAAKGEEEARSSRQGGVVFPRVGRR